MKIIIYTAGLMGKTGILTWTKNFVANMHNECKIIVLCQNIGETEKKILLPYADCQVYNKNQQYKCDIYLHNFQDNAIRGNIIARQTFILLHCDYGEMGYCGEFDEHMKYIAVSEDSAKRIRDNYNLDCDTISPFLIEYTPKKVYKFVSATRLHTLKGYNRMLTLCNLLKSRGVRFQWLVFSDSKKPEIEYSELIFVGAQPNEIVRDYMADADYVVQLSDHEGFCYSVHEALSVGTPCLVTDIPVFRNVVINGYNGYRLPLDMDNIPLDAILNCVPKDFNYRLKNDEIRQQWLARFKDG